VDFKIKEKLMGIISNSKGKQELTKNFKYGFSQKLCGAKFMVVG